MQRGRMKVHIPIEKALEEPPEDGQAVAFTLRAWRSANHHKSLVGGFPPFLGSGEGMNLGKGLGYVHFFCAFFGSLELSFEVGISPSASR